MSIRTTPLVENEYYHIYNRGNSKQIIYKDKYDYERFVGLLYACNSSNSLRVWNINYSDSIFNFKRDEQLVAIGAYVLMPNHFHILLTPLVPNGASQFMQKLSTAYSMYFNKKYDRSGGLFEGKFKSRHAGDDRYLKYLFSYIHLNPIKMIDPMWKMDGIKNKKNVLHYLNSYPYSSFIDFTGAVRKESSIIDPRRFPKYFPKPKDFEKEIISWFYNNKDEH